MVCSLEPYRRGLRILSGRLLLFREVNLTSVYRGPYTEQNTAFVRISPPREGQNKEKIAPGPPGPAFSTISHPPGPTFKKKKLNSRPFAALLGRSLSIGSSILSTWWAESNFAHPPLYAHPRRYREGCRGGLALALSAPSSLPPKESTPGHWRLEEVSSTEFRQRGAQYSAIYGDRVNTSRSSLMSPSHNHL